MCHYKRNYISCNFYSSYRNKINYAISLLHSKSSFNTDLSKNYINIIFCKKLFDYLDINNVEIDNGIDVTDKFLTKSNCNNKGYSILYCGPAYDINKINHSKYDYIAFNKPLVGLNTNIPKEKLIIILNNVWSKGLKSAKTIDWYKNNNEAKFITPVNMNFRNEFIYSTNLYPHFLSASLMGFQRGLIGLLNNFKIKRIDVVGMDFQLSSASYQSWYPSARLELRKSFHNGFIFSTMEHDFLFNFMFTKKILTHLPNVLHGDFINYLSLPYSELFDLLKQRILLK